uniref:Uncharacterized protein n=1 Tax=Amphimedon queenslandica TaxID=400682 RepID=A0A1X7UFB4_AMPQE
MDGFTNLCIIIQVAAVIIVILIFMHCCCPEKSPLYTFYPCFTNHKKSIPTGSERSLTKAAYLAFTSKSTLLRTSNDGKIYWDDDDREHAEEVFIEIVHDIRDIDVIWISNSPCKRCAEKLIRHFESKCNKPNIYIGRFKDKAALKRMKENGFSIKVWETKYNKDVHKTRNKLENIDKSCCTIL